MTPAKKMLIRDYALDLKAAVQKQYYTDVILLTKERIKLKVHKMVLSQNKFWHSLFKSVECCSGTCSSQPVTVLLPDYDFSTIRKMLDIYYVGNLKFDSEEESKSYLSLMKPFNMELSVDSLCRVCDERLPKRELISHLKQHIKDGKKRDIHEWTTSDFGRCSFKSGVCMIEKDRKKISNGIYNDMDVNSPGDKILQIKEHYRKHMRDELDYIENLPGYPNTLPSETELNRLTEINDDITDYSGGMTSPSITDNDDDSSKNKKKKKKKKVVPKSKGDSERVESSRNSETGGSDVDHEPSRNKPANKICKKCHNPFTARGFKGHMVTHMYDMWKEVSKLKKVYRCTEPNCDNAKEWRTRKKFINHLALVHGQLEEKLRENGLSIEDFEDKTQNIGLKEYTRCKQKSREPSGSRSRESSGPTQPTSGSNQRPDCAKSDQSPDSDHPMSGGGERKQSRISSSSTTDSDSPLWRTDFSKDRKQLAQSIKRTHSVTDLVNRDELPQKSRKKSTSEKEFVETFTHKAGCAVEKAVETIATLTDNNDPNDLLNVKEKKTSDSDSDDSRETIPNSPSRDR